MNGVNLIPGARNSRRRRRARAVAWAWACTGCAAALFAGAAAFRAARTIDPAGIRGQIDAATARADAAELELARLTARARERERALDAARIVGAHPDWSVLLRAVNASRGESVALESVELVAAPSTGKDGPRERYVLRLRGVATGVQDVTRFVTALEALGAMEKVWLKDTSARQVRGVNVSGFEIECTLAERDRASAGATP